ncbi:MAG: TonB-dependent receptor plug domain-containing protein, partial [Deltaproteobacteria bacterium]|nr:TonB-dependent receptor plug domain-containing protein [Deltaproteobacteria bacterium]
MKYSKIVLLGILLQLLFSADCLAQNLEPSAKAEEKQDSQEKKTDSDTDLVDAGTDSTDSDEKSVENNTEENVAETSPVVKETPPPANAAVTNEAANSNDSEELPGPVVLEKPSQNVQMQEELPGPVKVEEAPFNDILSLSLEQLLDITVVSASKRYEKASEAPATMTVWTRQDMDNLGYHNIYELADITPGFSSYYIYGERVLETRGRKAGSFENNKHLVMVDGIPVNHARGMKAPIEEDLPLYFADQVEFLTGPASALYGVSAYFGVINVTSQNPVENGGAASGRVSFGGPDFHRSVMGNTYYKNDSGTFKLALSYYEKDASGMQLGIEDEDYGLTYTEGYKNRLWDDKTALFLYASYRIDDTFLKGFEVGSINMLRTTGLGEHWMWGEYSPEANELQWGTFIPYVKYSHDFNDQIKLQSYVLYNRS